MLHNIIIYLSGLVSVGAFFQIRRVIHRPVIKPINLINGIVLPNVNDIAWQVKIPDNPTRWKALLNGNVVVYWADQTAEDLATFTPFIKLKGKDDFTIASGEEANKYVRAVINYHMKYIVESPEIKQLDSQ